MGCCKRRSEGRPQAADIVGRLRRRQWKGSLHDINRELQADSDQRSSGALDLVITIIA
jgi:hypothetical protein